MNFKNKVIIVTGSTNGIGEASAKRLAEYGAAVIISGRTEENGIRVVKEIEAAGGAASFHRTDVTDYDQCERLVEHAVKTFGGLHGAVNNAAGEQNGFAPLHEIEIEGWEKTFNNTARTVFYSMRAEIRHFVKHGGGAIVNLTSCTGLKGAFNLSLTSAAKHAIVGMTRSAALDYATQGIRVNAIAPGGIATPKLNKADDEFKQRVMRSMPMERMGQSEEIGEAVAFLLSDAASFITGTTLPVDGGFMQGSRR